MVTVYNPPADRLLRDSLDYVIDTSFSNAFTDAEPPDVYLTDREVNACALGKLTERATGGKRDAVISTLRASTAVSLHVAEPALTAHGLHVVHDYTNPYTGPENEKIVHFYSSDRYRPFLRHVFDEVFGLLQGMGLPEESQVTPIGSESLPDFPTKLDVDMVVCIPERGPNRNFAHALLDHGMFVEPREDLEDLEHRFFQAELMGTQVDLHLFETTLEDCVIYSNVQELRSDAELRERYKRFKQNSDGLSIVDYRAAKAEFRKEVGWDPE